jgi:hypothetical protein
VLLIHQWGLLLRVVSGWKGGCVYATVLCVMISHIVDVKRGIVGVDSGICEVD